MNHEEHEEKLPNKEVRKQESEFSIEITPNSTKLSSHCTPRALPQDDYYVILRGARPKGAWQSPFFDVF